MITPFPNLGPYLFLTGEAFKINRELRAAGVEIIPSHVVLEIDGHRLRGVHAFSPDAVEWSADSVVLVTQREPCDRAVPRASTVRRTASSRRGSRPSTGSATASHRA